MSYPLSLGDLPYADQLIPQTAASQLITGLSFTSGLMAFDSLMAGISLTAFCASVYRLDSIDERNGAFFNASKVITHDENKTFSEGTIDPDITAVLQTLFTTTDLVARATQSHQYCIIKVTNTLGLDIGTSKVINAIAIRKGIQPKQVKYFPVWSVNTSAYLVPLKHSQWKEVPYTNEHHQSGKLISYMGIDIRNQPIKADRKLMPHALWAGKTGSGKTEAIRTDIQSMLDSDTNPVIFIFDPKADMRDLKDSVEASGGWYVEDIAEGLQLLSDLSADAQQRKLRYSDQQCKNLWQYREKVSSTDEDSRPWCVYVDELAEIIDGKFMKKAQATIKTILRRDRAAGLCFNGGIQRPDAAIITGQVKNNLGLIVAFSHESGTDSGVTLDSTDAKGLPMQGGCVVKRSGYEELTYGRGAILN